MCAHWATPQLYWVETPGICSRNLLNKPCTNLRIAGVKHAISSPCPGLSFSCLLRKVWREDTREGVLTFSSPKYKQIKSVFILASPVLDWQNEGPSA